MSECYKLKYKDDYTKLPNSLKDTLGIVGFTKRGAVHTCYYPEFYEAPDESYANQCNLAKDNIEKLMANSEYFLQQDMHRIFDWHLNVCTYEDIGISDKLRIVQKNQRNIKDGNPIKYQHIADDIEFHLVDSGLFSSELQSLVSSGKIEQIMEQCKYELLIGDDFKDKIKIILDIDDEEAEKLTIVYNKQYISGLKAIKHLIDENFMDDYDEIMMLSNKYKNDLFDKTHGIIDHAVHSDLIGNFCDHFNEKFAVNFYERDMLTYKFYFQTTWIMAETIAH
jgi:hypothetical protein